MNVKGFVEPHHFYDVTCSTQPNRCSLLGHVQQVHICETEKKNTVYGTLAFIYSVIILRYIKLIHVRLVLLLRRYFYIFITE